MISFILQQKNTNVSNKLAFIPATNSRQFITEAIPACKKDRFSSNPLHFNLLASLNIVNKK